MAEIFHTISKYTFGSKFRILIYLFFITLVFFHTFVLAAPFIKDYNSISKLNDKQINHLRTISNSISNVTVALILMILIVEGQISVHRTISQKRKNYMQKRKIKLLIGLKP